MKTTKSIRILTGTKKIELADENFTLIQIREVLKEHRQSLISRLISDLGVYIGYKFNTMVKGDQLDNIKTRLFELKNSNVSISKYREVIDEILHNDYVHIKSNPFYNEINETIKSELHASQLPLMN